MENAPEPLVSIVTLNYNQAELTCEFLESTRKLNYGNFEILVCDMASDVDPAPLINSGRYPRTQLLRSNENLGYSGGNNWGIRQARGDYIFVVNNDTEVTPNLIGLLLESFRLYPRVAAVSPKIKFFHQPGIIQYAGFNRMNPYTGRTSTIGEMQQDLGQYDQPWPTHACHGCAMMIKKDAIQSVGMFPEKFFLYYEEWDLSARLIKAGYTIWYAGNAVIYHKESITVGRENPLKVYYHTRNRILFMRRNVRSFQLAVFIVFFLLFATPKAVTGFVLAGKYRHLKLFLKGIAWNMYVSNASNV